MLKEKNSNKHKGANTNHKTDLTNPLASLEAKIGEGRREKGRRKEGGGERDGEVDEEWRKEGGEGRR